MALKNHLKHQKFKQYKLSKAVEDGNIIVAHIAKCGNKCETKRKPSKTAT